MINKLYDMSMLPLNFSKSNVTIVGIINISPPKVGVPFFFKCLSPIVVLTFYLALILFNNGINIRPATIDNINPNIIAIAAFAKTSIYTPLPIRNYTTFLQ